MKNARSLLPAALAALFALALPAAARVLSQEEIETAAANFLAYDDLARELLPGRTVSSVEPRDALWIVDLDPAGYIVMSGSDAAEPVVAFGQNRMAGIDPEEPLYAMLALASTNCLAAEAAPAPAPAAAGEGEATGGDGEAASAARRAARWERMLGGPPMPEPGDELPGATPGTIIVQPLMSQHWNQWQPYNDYNPRVPDDSGSSYYRRRAATGCTATAYAQVMGYYRWPVRMDRTVCYTNTMYGTAAGHPYTSVFYRFDGSVPFEWDDIQDSYTSSGGDMSGYVAESVRYPIARLFNLNEVICEIMFWQLSKGSGGYEGTVGNNNPWYRGITNYDRGDAMKAAIKTALQAGEPVVVSVPDHTIVAHGYGESSDGTKYVYLNYGWAGSNDGWFDLNISSGNYQSGYIKSAHVGFVPYNSVQVDPLPAYSSSSVTLNWHAPEHWKSRTTGFKVTASLAGSGSTSFTDDFSTRKGTASGPVTVGVASATGNSTPVLGFDGKTIELQQYVWDGSFTLSSSSVLSFDFWSWKAANIKTFSLQASFDGGTWTDLYANDSLYNNNNGVSPAWTTQTIDLSAHAGSTARFRAIIPSADPSHYWFCYEGEEGVQIAVDNFQVTGVGSSSEAYSATVANTARSHTITGLTAGKTYSFTVTPIADNAADSGGASTTIASAAGTLPSISSVWADSSSTNQVKEGFFRNCALNGRTVLRVQASSNATALEAHSGNQTALPDSAIQVHSNGGGAFDVVFDTALTSEADDQRLLMTLVAKDQYGRTGAKNLSLRLLASVPSETYSPGGNSPPSLGTVSAGSITQTGATVSVPVTALGTGSSSVTVKVIVNGVSKTQTLSSAGTAALAFTGLSAGTQYTASVTATGSNGLSATKSVVFTTTANAKPTLGTVSVGSVTQTGATVSVPVTALGAGSSSVTVKVVVNGVTKTQTLSSAGTAALAFTGLSAGTQYTAAVTATGSNGLAATASATFTTESLPATGWFDVKWSSQGWGSGTAWRTSAGEAAAGGRWTVPAGDSSSRSGALLALGLPEGGVLRFTASEPTASKATVTVQGAFTPVLAASPPAAPGGTIAGLCFARGGYKAWNGAQWVPLSGATPAAASTAWTATFDYSQTKPRVRYAVGGTTLTAFGSEWIPLSASQSYVSGVGYAGGGSVGDFKASYTGGGYVAPVLSTLEDGGHVPLSFGKDGSNNPTFEITIKNAAKNAYYTVYASDTVDGAYKAVTSVKATADGLKTLSIPAPSSKPTRFVRIGVGESAVPGGTAL